MDMLRIQSTRDVVLHSGVVRMDCVSAAPNSEERAAGTVVISANIAAALLQAMTSAMRELEKKVQEQVRPRRQVRLSQI